MINIIFNTLSIVGAITISIISYSLLEELFYKIKHKVKDKKSDIRMLKKGTVYSRDGKKYRLTEDIVINFKKVKRLQCSCDSLTGILMPKGFADIGFKEHAESEFITSLINSRCFSNVNDLLEEIE